MKKIFLPGSKSISNRALVLAAISDKPTVLKGLLESDDIKYLRGVLENFGVEFESVGKDLKVIPPKYLKGNDTDNFIGNAGTSSRFTVALSLIVSGSFRLCGIPRMHERPFGDLISALRPTGVGIACEGDDGFLPAQFTNPGLEHLETNEVTIAGDVSSQFITGLLLAAPKMKKGLILNITTKIPSIPYVEMTLKMLDTWNVKYEVVGDYDQIIVKKGIKSPGEYTIPADMSAASIPLAWSVMSREPICIQNFGIETLQGDENFTEIIEKAGATIRRDGEKCFVVPGDTIKALGKVDFETMPDVSMTGMVLAAIGDGVSEFHGLESLRVKECDRIKAMVEGLNTLGIKTAVEGDIVKIEGNPNIGEAFSKNAETIKIDSFDDHRIAFTFAILLNTVTSWNFLEIYDVIIDAQCVTKTWPSFWTDLARWNDQLRPVSGVVIQKSTPSPSFNKEEEKYPLLRGELEGFNKKKLYLIVKKPRKDNAWQFPQGGVDDGESGWQAAKRELVEECGSDLCVKFKGEQALGNYQYLFPSDFKRHDSSIVGADVSFYLAEYIDGEVQVDGEEIIDHKWVTEDQLGEYFEKKYLQKIKKVLLSI